MKKLTVRWIRFARTKPCVSLVLFLAAFVSSNAQTTDTRRYDRNGFEIVEPAAGLPKTFIPPPPESLVDEKTQARERRIRAFLDEPSRESSVDNKQQTNPFDIAYAGTDEANGARATPTPDIFDSTPDVALTDEANGASNSVLPLLIALGVIGLFALCVLILERFLKRRNLSQTADRFIRSNCLECDGSIEFPAHGLGEWIDCPHCSTKIELKRTATVWRLGAGVRSWFQQRGFGWKWASALAGCVLVSGTALFIYLDYKSQLKDRINVFDPFKAGAQEIVDYRSRRDAFIPPPPEPLVEETSLATSGWRAPSTHVAANPSRPSVTQPLTKQGDCCQKSAAYGRICTHTCCVAANDDGRACEQCGGSGSITRESSLRLAALRRRQALDDSATKLRNAQMAQELDTIRSRPLASFQNSFPIVEPPRIGPALVSPSPAFTVHSFDSDSLSNPYGAGSPYKADGLMNPYSQYGSPYSSKSWRNPYATDAPKLYDSQGNYRGKLSANPYDADSTSNPYGRYGSPYSSESINNPYGLGSPYSSEPIYVVPSRR